MEKNWNWKERKKMLFLFLLFFPLFSFVRGGNESCNEEKMNSFCSFNPCVMGLKCKGIKDLVNIPLVEGEVLQKASFHDSALTLVDLKDKVPSSVVYLEIVGSRILLTNLNSLSSLKLEWNEIKILNLSRSGIGTMKLNVLLSVFPNLEELYVPNNRITEFPQNPLMEKLNILDISHNPLDCTTVGNWISAPSLKLINENETLCDQPPHQNKGKAFFETIRLIKRVKETCRSNCSCFIDYVWEVDNRVYSKNVVNCSYRGFTDFPDPNFLPHPTDTLILNGNEISSMKKFVEDGNYSKLKLNNLYLDKNQISSLNILEGSDWMHNFQIFSLRYNLLNEVPSYLLEKVVRQNKRIHFIDFSSNPWNCDCRTVKTFKIWLLQYSSMVKNIDEVRCTETREQVRYLKNEDWCKVEDDGNELMEAMDFLSIALAFLIIAVIGKVYYDYWNFKRYGKVPWLVGKF